MQPPEFPDLPALVELSENRTKGDVYTFAIVDPDKDTYTHSISSITPNTDIFYLRGMLDRQNGVFSHLRQPLTFIFYCLHFLESRFSKKRISVYISKKLLKLVIHKINK